MTPADLQRIAFVTRSFGALQGLRTVSYGAVLIFGVVAFGVLPDDFRSNPINVLITVQIVAGCAASRVDDYYRRCFGRVMAPRKRFDGPTRFSPGEVFHHIVVMAIMLDVLKSALLPASVPAVSIAGLVLITGSLRILFRDWPHRAHYLITVFAGVMTMVIVASAPVRRLDAILDPAVGVYYVLACGVIGLSLVAVSLLDHWLLVSAMSRPRVDSPSAPLHFGGLRAALAGAVLAALTVCTVVWHWPPPAVPVAFLLWGLVPCLAIALSYKDLFWGLQAYKERERAREAFLLERVKRSLAEATGALPDPPEHEVVVTTNGPVPDFTGHVVLPIAIATGALLDTGLHGRGLPSFLALGLAASHARIATRDWPLRRQYIIGALASVIAAGSHVWIDWGLSAFEWAVISLALLSAAMLFEGLLDRRIEAGPARSSADAEHANTI